MEILDCRRKIIKVSKYSITVKNENGITCGVVTNIRHFDDIQRNNQIEYFHLMKKVGIWGNDRIDINDLVIDKYGKLYLFRNINGVEQLRHYEPEFVIALDKLYLEITKQGITVIEAYFI